MYFRGYIYFPCHQSRHNYYHLRLSSSLRRDGLRAAGANIELPSTNQNADAIDRFTTS